MNFEVRHVSFIRIWFHKLTVVELYVAHIYSGWNPALTSIKQKLSDLRPQRAKIHRTYYVVTYRQLRNHFAAQNFPESIFLPFPS